MKEVVLEENKEELSSPVAKTPFSAEVWSLVFSQNEFLRNISDKIKEEKYAEVH